VGVILNRKQQEIINLKNNIMKTKKLILIGLLLSIVSFGFASSPLTKNEPASLTDFKKSEIREILSSQIENNATINGLKVEGIVVVFFTFDSDGAVIISGINSKSELLKNYVKSQLERIIIYKADQFEGTNFRIDFSFKNM